MCSVMSHYRSSTEEIAASTSCARMRRGRIHVNQTQVRRIQLASLCMWKAYDNSIFKMCNQAVHCTLWVMAPFMPLALWASATLVGLTSRLSTPVSLHIWWASAPKKSKFLFAQFIVVSSGPLSPAHTSFSADCCCYNGAFLLWISEVALHICRFRIGLGKRLDRPTIVFGKWPTHCGWLLWRTRKFSYM
jgi:hypothetical protein